MGLSGGPLHIYIPKITSDRKKKNKPQTTPPLRVEEEEDSEDKDEKERFRLKVGSGDDGADVCQLPMTVPA